MFPIFLRTAFFVPRWAEADGPRSHQRDAGVGLGNGALGPLLARVTWDSAVMDGKSQSSATWSPQRATQPKAESLEMLLGKHTLGPVDEAASIQGFADLCSWNCHDKRLSFGWCLVLSKESALGFPCIPTASLYSQSSVPAKRSTRVVAWRRQQRGKNSGRGKNILHKTWNGNEGSKE